MATAGKTSSLGVEKGESSPFIPTTGTVALSLLSNRPLLLTFCEIKLPLSDGERPQAILSCWQDRPITRMDWPWEVPCGHFILPKKLSAIHAHLPPRAPDRWPWRTLMGMATWICSLAG